jgi:tyrosyl-tRNA synthetase
LLIKAIGVDINELEIVKGSEMQLKPEYMYDVLQMSSHVSVHDATKAASDVVKATDNPKLSGIIYPIMQAMDEQYLEVDCQLGGTDQRKIMVLARENLPKIGYNSRIEIMNPIIPGLTGRKMSASDIKSKIDLLDDEEAIKKKLNDADCVAGNPDNGVMAFLKYVIMTIKKDKKEKFVIKRDKKYGGDLEYSNYEEVEKDFVAKKLHPLDLKIAVAKEIFEILKPIQKERKVLEKLEKEAYS